jgi:hypothetical protein
MAGKGQPKTGGRTKGTPNRATAEIKALAQEYGALAIETLANLMATATSEQARVAAARELLDRAYGKPAQQLAMDATIKGKSLAEELAALHHTVEFISPQLGDERAS